MPHHPHPLLRCARHERDPWMASEPKDTVYLRMCRDLRSGWARCRDVPQWGEDNACERRLEEQPEEWKAWNSRAARQPSMVDLVALTIFSAEERSDGPAVQVDVVSLLASTMQSLTHVPRNLNWPEVSLERQLHDTVSVHHVAMPNFNPIRLMRS